MGAEWRPVVGYEGLYEVSSLGEVRSIARCGTRGGLRKPKLNKIGYLSVVLHKGGVRRHFMVHRLVGEAFIGPRPEGRVTRHLNGKHTDNRAANLAYGTHAENQRDSMQHGTKVNFGRRAA